MIRIVMKNIQARKKEKKDIQVKKVRMIKEAGRIVTVTTKIKNENPNIKYNDHPSFFLYNYFQFWQFPSKKKLKFILLIWIFQN